MNRIIKFRAFNVCLEKMYDWEEVKKTKYFWTKNSSIFEKMQYTGLKDKNGVEIYEGDILDFYEGEWGGKFTPEVVEWDKIIGTWDMCGSLADLSEWRQVIGNIYEHKHLIGE